MITYPYHIDEGVLTLPAGFRDATVNVFEWHEKEGRIALMVQRERLEDPGQFETQVVKVTEPYPKLFAAYAEEEPMAVDLDVPVVSKRFRWRNETGVLYHHQIFLLVDRTMLLLTVAGNATSRDRADEILREALAGFALRERG